MTRNEIIYYNPLKNEIFVTYSVFDIVHLLDPKVASNQIEVMKILSGWYVWRVKVIIYI